MPYEIYFKCVQDEKETEGEDMPEEKPENITNPLWLKAPKDCTVEEYEDFYREVFPDINLPLFWIHLNVDYPFNLKGILYFPKQTDKLQVMPGEIKLFSNQVYIADNIKEVVPEFLMLLKGVIDCPDLLPAVLVTCAALGVRARLRGIKNLRLKESDRIEVLKQELEKLGARVAVTSTELRLAPCRLSPGHPISAHGDHRIAMAFGVLTLLYPDLVIEEPETVTKSFPDFWSQLDAIRKAASGIHQ